MTNKRDIELLISARDTTGRSFKDVTDNINALNRKIAEQVEAAEKGEISLNDLRRSQDALAQAGRDLAALQGQIDGYRRLEAQLEKNSAASEQAVADLAAYKAELAAAEAVTAAQERRLAGLERKVVTAGEAVSTTTAKLEAQSASLKSAGIDTAALDAAQQRVVASAREAGQGFASLGASLDDYSANARRAGEERKRLAEQEAAAALQQREAAKAAEAAAQTQAAAEQQRLRDQQAAQAAALAAQQAAENQAAQRNAFAGRVAEARELGEAATFVRLYTDALKQLGAADQAAGQSAVTAEFRAVGAAAVEASRDVSNFVKTGQTSRIASSEVADGLRKIIDPGREALRTLEGIEAQIASAGAVATSEKQSLAAYNDSLNDLSEASAALVRTGSLVDAFKEQEGAAENARQQFALAQAEVRRVGAAMQTAERPTAALARQLGVAEQKLLETGRALNQEEAKLGELSRALAQAGIQTDQLTAAQQRLTAAAEEAAAATEAGQGATGGEGGLFGLDPNKLQNLGFQLNDIFVSLASGQNLFTVLIQQGSQISQLFPPGLLTQMALFVARFIPIIAIFVALGLAIKDTSDKITALQQAAAQLNLRGITEIDPAKLIDLNERLGETAEEAEDAEAAMAKFLDVTSDPTQLDGLVNATTLLVEKLGVELPDATDLFVGVMEGGIEATEELATSTNLLTEEELAHADALFDAGRAAEARQFILDAVTKKLEESASLTETAFTPAVNNLKAAFSSFAGFLSRIFAPVIAGINEYISDAIIGFTFLTGLLAGKSAEEAGVEAIRAVQPRGPRPGSRTATDQQIRDRAFTRELDEELEQSRDLTAEERRRRAATNARREAQAAGVSQGVEDLAVQRAIAAENRDIARDAERAGRSGRGAASRAEAARRRAEREAATLARRQEQIRNQLDQQLRQLDSATGRGSSATLEQRLAIVDNQYARIFETLERARGLGLTTGEDGRAFADIEAEVNASKELLKQQERIKFFEEQVNLLTTQRADEVQNITEEQQRGARSVGDAFAAAEAVNARISPQIVAAAQSALEVARAIAGTTPSPEMVSLIARLERITSGEGVNNIAAGVATGGLTEQEDKLNALLADRNGLVEAYNTLRELGLRTDEETRVLTVGAYQSTATAIGEQVAQLRETVTLLNQQKDALTGLPLLSDTAYATWIARLDAVQAGMVAVDARITQVNQAAIQGIQNGVASAFQTAADVLVGLVSGTLSWGDALNSVLTAGLSLAQSFLQAIADVLIQMVALRFAQSLVGGPSGGLGGLFFHSGGIVGKGGSRRSRTGGMGSWIGAPKFHGGGGLGLRPNEYKAVLERGEEVLTEDSPRHINNIGKGGTGGGGAPSIKQVLLLDPAEVEKAMVTRSGQKSILSVIRSNAPTIKQMLGN